MSSLALEAEKIKQKADVNRAFVGFAHLKHNHSTV